MSVDSVRTSRTELPARTPSHWIAHADRVAAVALHPRHEGGLPHTELLTAGFDGAVTCPASWMFPSVSEADRAVGFPDGNAVLSFGCALLQTGRQTILLDTSLGCVALFRAGAWWAAALLVAVVLALSLSCCRQLLKDPWSIFGRCFTMKLGGGITF